MEKVKEDQRHFEDNEDKKIKGAYKIDEVWYKKLKVREVFVISKDYAREIIGYLHEENGHIGTRKLWTLFGENYVAKKDSSIVKEVCEYCKVCQSAIEKNYHNSMTTKSIVTNKQLQIVAMDFIGNLMRSEKRNTNLSVIVDVYSKLIKTFQCKRSTAKVVIECLEKYIEEVGRPE